MSPTISKTDTALVFDHGKIVRDAQKQVQKAIDQLVDAGAERGLQVAAYRGPDLVVDAVAGVADPESGRPVTPDTPFYSYSVGKGATSTIIHILAQRGLFEYDTPVVALWPEFGAHGQQSVTVRPMSRATAGPPYIQGRADVDVSERGVWQPHRRSKRRHPGRWQGLGQGHRPDVRGAADRGGWPPAHLPGAAPRGNRGLVDGHGPGLRKRVDLGTGVRDRGSRSRGAGLPVGVRPGWRGR